jgi:hypothetical protein
MFPKQPQIVLLVKPSNIEVIIVDTNEKLEKPDKRTAKQRSFRLIQKQPPPKK